MQKKLFISYSHKDAAYAQAIMRQLTAYGMSESMIFLDRAGSGIKAGDDWRERIDDAIFDSAAALFILSPNFTNSDFIMKDEMPKILEARHTTLGKPLNIYWVKVEEITVPKALTDFQGFAKEANIGVLMEGERQKIIDEIAKTLAVECGSGISTREEIYGRLKEICRRNFSLRLGRPKHRGVNSVSFIGYGAGYKAHVKARYVRAADTGSDVTNEQLQDHLLNVRALEHPAFVKVLGGVVEDSMHILVTENLSRTRNIVNRIERTRKEKGRLHIDRVRLALSTLSAALQDYHDKGLVYGNITPKDVLTEVPRSGDWRVRLQSLRMSQIDNLSKLQKGVFTFNPYRMSYLAPEQLQDIYPTQKTDQYALALLILELLLGKLPVRVKNIADLQRKEVYFSDTKRLQRMLENRSPRLAEVLLKMLASDPDARFETIGEIYMSLEIGATTAEDNRRLAKASFTRVMENREEFFSDFYAGFFADRPDLETFFKDEFEGTRHFEKLERAVLYLLNFSKEDALFEPTILTGIRESHARFQLKSEDFDHFEVSLLRALATSGAKSLEIQEAWRLSIASGINYMKQTAVPSKS